MQSETKPKPKPMSDAVRRKVRKGMVGDILDRRLHCVANAAVTGDYDLAGRDGREVHVEDTKGVQREAKAILKSLRAWARNEKKA